MAFITAVTDVQDSNGDSVVVQNADGTRSPLALRLGAGLAATFAKSGDRGIVSVDISTVPIDSQTTTDGSTVSLGPSIALPPSSVTLIRFGVVGRLQTAATTLAAAWIGSILCYRLATGNATVKGTTFDSGFAGGPAPFNLGGVGFTGALSPAAVQIQAVGVSAPSAWSATTYTAGQLVTKTSNVYIVTSISGSGTSTTGPSGTGTGQVDNAGANQVVWDYLAAGTAVPVTWSLMYALPYVC